MAVARKGHRFQQHTGTPKVDTESTIIDKIVSTMKESDSGLSHQLAKRIRGLRLERAISLDALAAKSGVSRSMISLIERGESSPTAVVLEKLASGLGVTLASLFDARLDTAKGSGGPIARRKNQPQWQDPASGYVRRNVSPPDVPQPMQIVEVHFPPGAKVAFDATAREMRVYQQIWVLVGSINITVGPDCHRLREGDCLAMQLGCPTMFHNPTRKPARYAVVLVYEPHARKR